jgi:hypothetical protein
MANIQIIVTDQAGTVVYNKTHATRYSVSSMIRKVRTAVANAARIPADRFTAEGYEIANPANAARVVGATWVEAPSASE